LDPATLEHVEHFVAEGEGASLLASQTAIVEGFASLAEITVILAVLVGLAAFFIRRSAPAASADSSAEQALEADAASGA
jgi:hypothetical protein